MAKPPKQCPTTNSRVCSCPVTLFNIAFEGVGGYLQEDLKSEIHDSVRIYLYGYDSGWMTDALIVDVPSLAQNLLDTIKARCSNKDRTKDGRILFVTYSYGCLLVKEALVIDALEESEASIASRTDGILFFGRVCNSGVLL